ncbi:MAG TPA: DoxX family protein [Acidiphilium sp.]|nr:DoxX family protein [Acidiphilium sp.]HQU25166.1 DoxX family protein [Acidiphilium sp.]
MIFLNLWLIPFIARLCLVVMFPFSGYDKIVHWDTAMSQASSAKLPGARWMLIAAIIIEITTPVCIVLGWHDRLAAFLLAGFCVVTALLYHPFWDFPGFWEKDGVGRGHFWDFLKNFGLTGGLLLVVVGGVPAPALHVVNHPLSNAPYSAHSRSHL